MTDFKKIMDDELAPRIADRSTYMAAPADEPLLVAKTDLIYVWDHYRNCYLDFANGGLYPIGHGRLDIRARLTEQLNQHASVGPQDVASSYWPVEYAKKLSESLPGLSESPRQMFYFDTENEAQRAAVNMAVSATQKVPVWLNLVDDDGVPQNPNVAQDIAARSREGGNLIAIDESRIGFGRVGTFWGQERWGVEADITVVGGPAGGGFPFGAVIAAPELFTKAHLNITPTAGHPAVCAIGAQTMDQINPTLLAHVSVAGAELNKALAELKTQFPGKVSAHRGAGLLQVIDLKSKGAARRFRQGCLEQGLLLPPPRGFSIDLIPPLIISENEVRRAVDMMAGVFLDSE